jgi:hypothetical protein
MSLASKFRILHPGSGEQSAKRVGLDQAPEPLSGAPMPQEPHPISEAVGGQLRPAGLGPGEQMEGRLKQGPWSLPRSGVGPERVECGRTGIVLCQGLLDGHPPSPSVGCKRDTPSAQGAPRRVSASGTPLNDLGPGGAILKTRDDDGLNHLQQVMPKTEEEAGQERNRVTTGFTEPALDVHWVHGSRRDRLAQIKAMPDEELDGLTVRADFRARECELGEMVNVHLDRAMKFGYNDHVLRPALKG